MADKLVYVGKIIEVGPIEGADRIHLATAVCGAGGKWRGVVPKDLVVGSMVYVFQPDSVLPDDVPDYAFMAVHKFRVKQRKFKGAPSESLILPAPADGEIGRDVTAELRVEKYEKAAFMHLSLEALGPFPGYLPKTDEPNFQRVGAMIDRLQGKPYYITKKVDGTSSTAFKTAGYFGVCSRNLEIKDGPNPIWDVVRKYKLQETLPDGFAVQWETCGPKVQENRLGLRDVQGFAFQIWDIANRKYLDFEEFLGTVRKIMPMVELIQTGDAFDYSAEELQIKAENLTYANGKPAEGMVVRPMQEIRDTFHNEMLRLSFKVVNLKYKD